MIDYIHWHVNASTTIDNNLDFTGLTSGDLHLPLSTTNLSESSPRQLTTTKWKLDQ